MKKLFTRAITGGLYVALIICSLVCESQYLFYAVFLTFIVFGIWEFQSLTDNKQKNPKLLKFIDVIGGITMFISFSLLANDSNVGIVCLTPYLAYLIIRNIAQLYIQSTTTLDNWAQSFMGQLFVALPLSFLNFIYFNNPLMLLAIFIFIWLNDTGAYCVGTLIGKHRLFERISPKKSWEGFWGGLILCVISGAAIATWLNSYFNGPQLYGWIVLAAIVSIFSTWGDLCESLIKRSIGVKDSGKILPGHGGILDRIDSLLLVSPTALLFFTILELISK
ncbi:MAG: phosphatidate cytidylyltransferase [Muribaculaceae bacterium]|nr:phosphatidate cytidylyltransferase [Muribaculaceae bacterium]MEE1338265.1 phosphatidate cytidylyltransferase [Muribaculaceae bacterium]